MDQPTSTPDSRPRLKSERVQEELPHLRTRSLGAAGKVIEGRVESPGTVLRIMSQVLDIAAMAEIVPEISWRDGVLKIVVPRATRVSYTSVIRAYAAAQASAAFMTAAFSIEPDLEDTGASE